MTAPRIGETVRSTTTTAPAGPQREEPVESVRATRRIGPSGEVVFDTGSYDTGSEITRRGDEQWAGSKT